MISLLTLEGKGGVPYSVCSGGSGSIEGSLADPDPNLDPDPHGFGPSGSGSICQRHGFADPDPDPHKIVMDQQHWLRTVKA
jgi:hypothetical protein